MRWVMVLVLPLALACESGSFKPETPVEPVELFWNLELNHHAVVLSTTPPFDTLQLVATSRNYQGTPLAGLPAVQYLSKDPAKVSVTPEGMLVATRLTSEPVWVVATLITANIRHRDSVQVKVIASANPPPVLASFSIHPLPPDSAKLAVSENLFRMVTDTLRARTADPNGVSLDTLGGGIPVHFSVSDLTTVMINTFAKTDFIPGKIVGLKPGSVNVYASTTVFGVAKADTLPYRIGYPIVASIEVLDQHPIRGSFDRPKWIVGTGAHVVWKHDAYTRNPTFQAMAYGFGTVPVQLPFEFKVDVTFDEASLPNVTSAEGGVAATDGNILYHCTGVDPTDLFSVFSPSPAMPLVSDCTNGGNFVLGGGTYITNTPPYPLVIGVRRFKVPGTYNYRSTMHGTSGQIVVVDN